MENFEGFVICRYIDKLSISKTILLYVFSLSRSATQKGEKIDCRSSFGGKNKHTDASSAPEIICRSIKRYEETGSIKITSWRWPTAHCNSTSDCSKLRCEIQRNPKRSTNEMAMQPNVIAKSIRRILKEKLKVQPKKKICARGSQVSQRGNSSAR